MNQSITKKITTITAFLMLMFSVNTFGQIQPDVPTDAPPIFEKTISDVVNGPYEKTIEFTQNEDEFTVFEIAGYGVNTYEILNGNINLKDTQPYPANLAHPRKTYLLQHKQCSICSLKYGAVEEKIGKTIEITIKKYDSKLNQKRLEAENLQQRNSNTINIKNKFPFFEREIQIRESIGEKLRAAYLNNAYLYEKAVQNHISTIEIESLLDKKIVENHHETNYLKSLKFLTLGQINLIRGNYDLAINNLNKSLSLIPKSTSEKSSTIYGIHLSNVYTSLSQAYLDSESDSPKTKLLIEKAITLSKEYNQYVNQELSYNNLGFLERQHHNLDSAINYHKIALNIAQSSSFSKSVYEQELLSSLMRSNYYLAVVSAIKGRYYESINLIEKSEEIALKLDIPHWTAHIKAAKARIFLELKQYDKSLTEYKSAWKIYEEMNDSEQLGVLSINLGRLYSEIGDSELAFQYIDKSYELFSEPKDVEYKIKSTSALANALLTNKDFIQASKLFDELIILAENSKDLFLKGRSLTNKAESLINLEEYQQATKLLEHAIFLQKERKDNLYETRSNYLMALALSKLNNNNFHLVKDYLSSAKENIESIRSTLHDDSLRQQYFSLQKSIYELEISLYMEKPESEKNLINSIISAENFRARTLYESIIRKNLTDPPLPTDTLEKSTLSENRFLELEKTIKIISKNSYQPQNTNTLNNLQILNHDTAILYYFIGSEKSFSWLITSEKIYFSKLPASPNVALEVNSYINNINIPPAGNLNSNIWKKLYNETNSLSSLLLSPHIENIKKYRNIIISPDGPLHKIPFSALNINQKNNRIEYLSENHIISYIPSILTYKQLSTTKQVEEENSLLLVSNPEIKKIINSKDDFDVSLPSAHQEAKTIIKLWQNIGHVTWLDGNQASKKNIQNLISEQYQILHFATHAIANWDYPGQSSIALSNTEADSSENPNLTLKDITNLNISPDLVILSACDTAVGKQIEGEGPIGLSRAFLEAGSNKVIASLWPINDEASAELMGYFYKNLLLQNKSPVVALSLAQEKLRQNNKWSHPYYWSGFNLYGNNN